MKLILIRHADPDYPNDNLTEKGLRQASLLGPYLKSKYPEIKGFYCSTLRRARLTAESIVKAYGQEPEYLEWLREFDPRIWRPDDAQKMHICWDWLPEDWAKDDNFLSLSKWTKNGRIASSEAEIRYNEVSEKFDAILKDHGYERDGRLYKVNEGNHDVLLFVCHFGVASVILSHLLSISPMLLWHGTCMLPSSFTVLQSEERREGTAYFRATQIGAIPHLEKAEEKETFHAMFCECFQDSGRHDD